MHGRTQALAIHKAVKIAVAERDSVDGHPCCVWCGKPAPTDYETAFSNAHYISRAQGGLGIEENILTLCPECHRAFDQSTERAKMRAFFKDYLSDRYEGWTEGKLIFRKDFYHD